MYELGLMFGSILNLKSKTNSSYDILIEKLINTINLKIEYLELQEIIELNLPIQLGNNFIQQKNEFNDSLIKTYRTEETKQTFVDFLDIIIPKLLETIKMKFKNYNFQYEDYTIYIIKNH